MRELLVALTDWYREGRTEAARVRTLQGDLKYLCDEGEITRESSSGEGTVLRYRNAALKPMAARSVNLADLYQDLLQQGIAEDLVAEFVQRVEHFKADYFSLAPGQFVTVPDTVPLIRAHPIDVTIQAEILEAMRHKYVLNASYRKPGCAEGAPRRLHPLGVLLRGSQHYLIAYDEKDLGNGTTRAKMFRINRFVDAAALPESALLPDGVTVADLVRDEGLADFAHDPTPIKIRLRVWGYVRQLLEDNLMAPSQQLLREAGGESAIVTANIVQSGTLYRWILGFGDKVEVLEPKSLRAAVAWQARSVTEYYQDLYDEVGDADDDEADRENSECDRPAFANDLSEPS